MKKIRVSKSKIAGTGIYAEEKIKRHDFIGFFKGEIKNKVNTNAKDSDGHPDWLGFKKNYWIDPLPPYLYINHSCEPNCGIAGTKKIYAIKDIQIGEELTFDYSISEIDTNWKLHTLCQCGSKTCRKTISSIQSLSKSKVKEYLPYIPTHFKKFVVK